MRRRIYWDIETTDLNANWGSILCIGYAIDDGPVNLISITDFKGWEKAPWDDKKVIQKFLSILEGDEIGVEVTHYGTNFDIKFLQARMLYHRLGVFPKLDHVDTYYAAKAKLAIKSRSLGAVAEHARIRYKKTPLSADVWRKAGRGDKKSLQYIGRHCIADIRVLRAVYKVLAPMLRMHPAIGDYEDCHVCGSSKLQRRGYTASTKGGIRARVQCQKCGSWGARAIEKEAA